MWQWCFEMLRQQASGAVIYVSFKRVEFPQKLSALEFISFQTAPNYDANYLGFAVEGYEVDERAERLVQTQTRIILLIFRHRWPPSPFVPELGEYGDRIMAA